MDIEKNIEKETNMTEEKKGADQSLKRPRSQEKEDSGGARKRQRQSEITPSISFLLENETNTQLKTWKLFLDYSWNALTLVLDVSPRSMQQLKIQIRFMDAFPIPPDQVDIVSHNKNPFEYKIRPLHPIVSLRRKQISSFSREDCKRYIAQFVDFYTKAEENNVGSLFPEFVDTKNNAEFIKQGLSLSATGTTLPNRLNSLYRTFILEQLQTIACPEWTSEFWKETYENKEYKMPAWMVEIPDDKYQFADGEQFFLILDPAITSDGEVVSLARQYSFFLGRVNVPEQNENLFKIHGGDEYAKFIKGGFINKRKWDKYEFINMTLTPSDAHQDDQENWLFETIGYNIKDVCENSFIKESNLNRSFENITQIERFNFVWQNIFQVILSELDGFHLTFDEKLTLPFLVSTARSNFFEKFKSFTPNDLPDDQDSFDFDKKSAVYQNWDSMIKQAYAIFVDLYKVATEDAKREPLPVAIPQKLYLRLTHVKSQDGQKQFLSNLKFKWERVYWSLVMNQAKPDLLTLLATTPEKACVLLPRRDCSQENCGGTRWTIDFPFRFFRVGFWDLGIRTKNENNDYNDRIVVSIPRHAEITPIGGAKKGDQKDSTVKPYPIQYRDSLAKFPEAQFLVEGKSDRSWRQLFGPFSQFQEQDEDKKSIWYLTPPRIERLARAWAQYQSQLPLKLLSSFKDDLFTIRSAEKGYSRIIIFSNQDIETVSVSKKGEFKGENKEEQYIGSTFLQAWITADDQKIWSFDHVNAASGEKFYPARPHDNQIKTITMFLIAPDEYENTKRAITGYYELLENSIPMSERYEYISTFSDLVLSEITATKSQLSKLAKANDEKFNVKMLDIVRRQSLWKWISYFRWITLQSYKIRLEKDLGKDEETEIRLAIKNSNTNLGNVLKI